MTIEPLELEDLLAVEDLVKLRARSMENPNWRDATYLQGFVRRGHRWKIVGPLEPFRLDIENRLATYEKATKRHEPAVALWSEVIRSVDRLIAEAERLAGHPLKPRFDRTFKAKRKGSR